MTLRPAVFLDRDGTIIAEKVYLSDPDGVDLIAGTIEALRSLREAGFVLVIVTNQAGVARDLYSLNDYRAVASRLAEVLAAAGASVDATYFCPHHPDATGPCECRKPGTGMYLQAAREHGLDLAASYYVGDKRTDVLPARELGGQGILVRTGYGSEHEADAPEHTWTVDDLRSAAAEIRRDCGR